MTSAAARQRDDRSKQYRSAAVGGCIPQWRFDLPIDYDSLTEAGAIMGSGGMIVLDDNTCMVDLAKYFMNFLRDESCGKCFTCRKGTQRMWEILDDITKGQGTLEQLDLLAELARTVKDTTMCGLGQSAPIRCSPRCAISARSTSVTS